jgi:hypothetical protein
MDTEREGCTSKEFMISVGIIMRMHHVEIITAIRHQLRKEETKDMRSTIANIHFNVWADEFSHLVLLLG